MTREPDRFEAKARELCAERGIENAKTRRIIADALRQAADDMKSPAAAPAAVPMMSGDGQCVGYSPAPPSAAAPSLLPRVLAALELAYSGDLMTMGLYGQYYALAAELRRYIADQPAAGASEESTK